MLRCCLKLSILILLVFLSPNSSAQFYEYGQDPGITRWNHFSSEHYKLIYPRGLDSLAMDFADKLEYYYPYQAEILDHKHPKLPVVFHNESSFSNGLLSWAPKRLEVFTNPDPNGYPQDWMTQLAIHEGRHAVQVSKLNQGFAKGLSFIAGEQAIGVLTGFLPLWYLEGDAVDAETRFSNSGRGRLPSFEMGTKAILLEKGQAYSFSKSILGSYKDYVPNHYQIGYLLVRYGRRTFGNDFWTDMENYVARKPYLIVPTYFSMRKHGVHSKKTFYSDALDLYRVHWQKTLEGRNIGSTKKWSLGSKHYTNYNFPQWINDSMLIAYKTGIDQIPEFVTIDSDGIEERVFRPGSLNSGRFSYSKGKLIWDEWIPDIRWTNRNYSIIRLYDTETGKLSSLGSRTRYYSPALSKNGNRIACVEQGIDYSCFLVVLDLDGKVIQSVKSVDNHHLQHPNWMENDTAIVLTMTTQSGVFLYKYSLNTERWSKLFHGGFDGISAPVVSGEEIFFSSTSSGIDNIYSFNMKTKELNQITSSAFGAVEPSISPDENNLTFADYHSGGYQAVSAESMPRLYEKSNSPDGISEQLDAQQTMLEKSIIDSAEFIQDGEYQLRPYRKLFNSINIHSWLPLYFDYMNPEAALTPDVLPLSIGATVLTQNLLSTVTGMVGYEFRDKTHFLHSGVRLKGKYPIVDLSINYGGYPFLDKINNTDNVQLELNRLTFIANTYIPFRLNTGKYITFFQPLVGYTYTSDILPDENQSAYVSGIHTLHYRFYFSSSLRRGKKDILPRLGISIYAGFKNAPFNSYNFGSLSYSGLSIYIPGLIKHQSLRMRYSSQSQNPENYFFSNSISLPRGIKHVIGLDMKLLSADYTFPIAYPDLNLGPIVFIKRIRGNLWIDYLRGKDIYIREPTPALEDKNYSSYGADLLFDFHLARLFFPISMGTRVSYIPKTGKLIPELLFTVDVN